jgi:hypothetical protein
MAHPFARRLALAVFGLAVFGGSVAAAPAGPPAPGGPVLGAAELAARIDRHLGDRLKQRHVPPAPVVGDAAFIRRVFLDLAGRIPSILEVRDFLDDDRPDKRRIWVDLLLKGIKKSDQGSDPGDSYSDHFAGVWRHWLIQDGDNGQGIYSGPPFEGWLRQQLRDNAPYDRLVRSILTAAPGFRPVSESAAAFYQANENKAENLAAATARQFLGLKLECAQCHDDRSGGNWTREQFWELAAFFGDLPRNDGQRGGRLEITIPHTRTTVKAGFPDGTRPNGGPGADPRTLLADWVTSANNPHFARAAVNRLWAYLFGTGLVEPTDERGDHNPPSHPALLDELAQQFVLHKFDLKYLLRALVLSQAYQRSSLATHPGQDNPRLFARMAVRGLSAQQLFDSLAEATEYKSGNPQPFGYNRAPTPRDEFIARFLSQEKKTELHTSILQALHLMNGPFMTRATSLEQNRTLATIADAARIDTARRLETLYLVALTRKPTEKELKRLVPYVTRGGPSGNPRKALADIFWALLNSSEFFLNH